MSFSITNILNQDDLASARVPIVFPPGFEIDILEESHRIWSQSQKLKNIHRGAKKQCGASRTDDL
jgi:hypothetical protein